MPEISYIRVVFDADSDGFIQIDSDGDLEFASDVYYTAEQVALAQELQQIVAREND